MIPILSRLIVPDSIWPTYRPMFHHWRTRAWVFQGRYFSTCKIKITTKHVVHFKTIKQFNNNNLNHYEEKNRKRTVSVVHTTLLLHQDVLTLFFPRRRMPVAPRRRFRSLVPTIHVNDDPYQPNPFLWYPNPN